MDRSPAEPGKTQDFIRSAGFRTRDGRMVLVDENGRDRLFLELTGDPDEPRSDPVAAYTGLLSALPPGAAVRFLQIHWPDQTPRAVFLNQTGSWNTGGKAAIDTLRAGLIGYLEKAPIPFHRRTILEVALPEDGDSEWVSGAVGLLGQYGIDARRLEASEIEALLRWFFNPTFR